MRDSSGSDGAARERRGSRSFALRLYPRSLVDPGCGTVPVIARCVARPTGRAILAPGNRTGGGGMESLTGGNAVSRTPRAGRGVWRFSRDPGGAVVRRLVVTALGSSVLLGLAAPAAQPATAAETYPSWCRWTSNPVARADELLANRFLLSPHPIVTLPADPTWRENPLKDANWQFQFHAMRYVLDLLSAWKSTGVDSYRSRALFLLHDWSASNPRSNPPSA